MNTISGIYKIVNTKNGKFYLGSSKNIKRRWHRHKSALKHNKHHCIYLQRSWNKHGGSSFAFEIIKEMPNATEPELLNEETKLTNELLPEYNIGSVGGGDNLTNNPNREDIIRRITETLHNKLAAMTEQERKDKWAKPGDKNPNWRGGTTFCECGNRISSNANCCAECFDNSGEKNAFYGKHHTQKTIERLRQISLGRRLSPDTIEKCKKASMDFYNSADGIEYRKLQSQQMSGENHFLYGIGHTEDSCNKISKTKLDKLNNMSIQERYVWNKMRKIRIVRIKSSYYVSLLEAMKHYSKSHASLRFRCESSDEKWNDYEFINIVGFDDEQDKDMINKLTLTNLTPILHT